jgi:hypothetical protein
MPVDGRRLNSPVLPMIDLPVESRTLRAGETQAIGVSVSNFGEDDIRDGVLSWRLLEGAQVVAGSEFTARPGGAADHAARSGTARG